jgi:hypothetical protein
MAQLNCSDVVDPALAWILLSEGSRIVQPRDVHPPTPLKAAAVAAARTSWAQTGLQPWRRPSRALRHCKPWTSGSEHIVQIKESFCAFVPRPPPPSSRARFEGAKDGLQSACPDNHLTQYIPDADYLPLLKCKLRV